MNDKLIKRGQIVYLVPLDTRLKPTEATVVKVGSKYITTDYYGYRFDAKAEQFPIDSCECPDGWNLRMRLFLSRKHYYEQQFFGEACNTYRKQIADKLTGINDVPTLERINNFIEQLIKRSLCLKK